MSPVNKIEKIHNYLSDTNYVWFPFLFLKLQPHQLMSIPHRLHMTFWFALYFVLGDVGRSLIWDRPITLLSLITAFAWGLALFFLWFNLVTAFFWNRRARRLEPRAMNKPPRP